MMGIRYNNDNSIVDFNNFKSNVYNKILAFTKVQTNVDNQAKTVFKFFNHVPASILFSATVGSNTLHLRNQTNGFDCTILWGDGEKTIVPVNGGNITHSYSVAGNYNIQITGKSFAGFSVIDQIGKEKYKKFYSIGRWEKDTAYDFSLMFFGRTNLTTILVGLFDRNTEMLSFNSAFYGRTSLAGLFSKNIKAIDFSCTFQGCSSLVEIPSNLFDGIC